MLYIRVVAALGRGVHVQPVASHVGAVEDALGDTLAVSTSRTLGLVNLTIGDGVVCLDSAALSTLADLLETAVLDLRKVHR